MKLRLDALIAEIAQSLDLNLLMHDPEFASLPRFNRMHFIMRCLARCDIARGEKRGGRKVFRWRPSHRLESNFGAQRHGIPDELERIDAPICINTLADEFFEVLQANGETVEKIASYVLRRFGMYALGLLEYRGKEDGVCQFVKSSRRIDVVDEAGNTTDFVEKYLT